MSPWAGVFAKDKPKAVQAWQDRIYARAAVQKGLVSSISPRQNQFRFALMRFDSACTLAQQDDRDGS